MPRIKSYSKKDSIGKIIFSNEFNADNGYSHWCLFYGAEIVFHWGQYYHGYKNILKYIDGD